MRNRLLFLVALFFGLSNGFSNAFAAPPQAEWMQEIAPFKITGNLYYVGSADLAAYLVVTPQGNILINSNLETSPPQIQHSIEKLGFKMSDIKILLISHAHYDHDAGSAGILRMTHAQYMVMDADVPAVQSGGKNSPEPDFPRYPPTKVTRVLHDGDTVSLGGTILTAHKTAGHTPGCTTWTLREDGKDVVIVGSPNINPGTKLVDNRLYPQIAADFAAGFQVLHRLHCDIFLGAHGLYFDMKKKIARLQAGEKDIFVDPAGYQAFVDQKQKDFEAELRKQQIAARTNHVMTK